VFETNSSSIHSIVLNKKEADMFPDGIDRTVFPEGLISTLKELQFHIDEKCLKKFKDEEYARIISYIEKFEYLYTSVLETGRKETIDSFLKRMKELFPKITFDDTYRFGDDKVYIEDTNYLWHDDDVDEDFLLTENPIFLNKFLTDDMFVYSLILFGEIKYSNRDLNIKEDDLQLYPIYDKL
jgi:hypothetical protein